MEAQPPRRSDDIVFEQLDDGAVIYDSRTKQAHSLDPLATRVLTAADGEHTPAEIATEVGVDEASVNATLERLTASGLLLPQATGVSRRDMLKRTAVVGAAATAAAAVIETVVIPTPEAHASLMVNPVSPLQ